MEEAAQYQERHPTSNALVSSPGTAESEHLRPASLTGSRRSPAPEICSVLTNTSLGGLIIAQAPGGSVKQAVGEALLIPTDPTPIIRLTLLRGKLPTDSISPSGFCLFWSPS